MFSIFVPILHLPSKIIFQNMTASYIKKSYIENAAKKIYQKQRMNAKKVDMKP
jgi:hypothetical protein